MTQNIPMSSPDLSTAEIEAVNSVIRTSHLSLGPRLAEFEKQFANYVGARFAVGVSSGTAGLHLGIIAASVKDGDLVITTPFSFIASANCILYERAIPIFVDVEPHTGNIDPNLVAAAVQDIEQGLQAANRWLPPALRNGQLLASRLTKGQMVKGQLKAILPVHAFGQPADMAPLLTIARQHNLAVIEDACEALGAEYKGQKVGRLSDATIFAFYPNKQLTTGEGGMIVTDNETWAHLFQSLRNQGRDTFNAWLSHSRLGYNYRLDELSAALGLAQIRRIKELLFKRAQVAKWYHECLAGIELIERPNIAPFTTYTSWFVYVIQIKPPANRNRIIQKLAEAGIPSRPYFSPIHLQPFYREKFGYREGDFPVTEHLGRVSLALPFSGVMTRDQVECVSHTLNHALQS